MDEVHSTYWKKENTSIWMDEVHSTYWKKENTSIWMDEVYSADADFGLKVIHGTEKYAEIADSDLTA